MQRHVSWRSRPETKLFLSKIFKHNRLDSFSYYWHDMKGDNEFHYKKQFGGNSLIVLTGISEQSMTDLFVTRNTINFKIYT